MCFSGKLLYNIQWVWLHCVSVRIVETLRSLSRSILQRLFFCRWLQKKSANLHNHSLKTSIRRDKRVELEAAKLNQGFREAACSFCSHFYLLTL